MRLLLVLVRLPLLLVRTLIDGLLSFAAMIFRRPAVPPGAITITHSRTMRIVLWISIPGDTIGFLILGFVLDSRVPAAGPYVTGVGIFAFLLVLSIVSQMTHTPHYADAEGLTIRSGRRKSWTVPADSIAGVGWSPSPIDRKKATNDVAILDPMAQLRIELTENHRVKGLPTGVREVWFGADDKRAADQIRNLYLKSADAQPNVRHSQGVM